jgi:hypothetical protein
MNRNYRTPTQELKLEGGDSLMLKLAAASRKELRFERRRYVGKQPAIDPGEIVQQQPVPGTAWDVAFLQNQAEEIEESRQRRLNAMVVLEKELGVLDPRDLVQLSRPSLAWFEVTTEKGKPPPTGLRFYPLYDYPAPSYGLEVPAWPEDPERSKPGKKVWRRPVVSSYWLEKDAEMPIAGRLTEAQGHFKNIRALTRFKVPDATDEDGKAVDVYVESVAQVPREVEVRPGVRQMRECLVVRLRFPKGKPFFVQLPDTVARAGYEHHFYNDAGKYIGVFWKVTREEADTIRSLNVISVDTLKRRAPYKLEDVELPQPGKRGRPQKPE